MPSRLDKFRDFDAPDDGRNRILAGYYDAAAERLRSLIIDPTGKQRGTQQWTQARAAALASQVHHEMKSLRDRASGWTGKALAASFRQGVQTADEQAVAAGVLSRSDAPSLKGSFHVVDTDAVRQFARDTYGDLAKAADSMDSHAQTLLHRMAAEGVTNEEVNRILAGGVIEGKPKAAIRELRVALEKVHGKQVTIQTRSGPMTFQTDYYAGMVANTKTRQAVCQARHERLAGMGMDLVTIVGRRSKNFCTAYLDKVFSISGKSKKYPALSALPSGGPPFHPNCSKSTAPFVEELATPEELAAAEPDRKTTALMEMNRNQQQVAFGNERFQQQVEKRHGEVVASITKGAELPIEHETTERADTFADRQYGRWADGVRKDAAQHDAIQSYQQDSSPMNRMLRGQAPRDSEIQRQIDAASSAIDAAPTLKQDTFVFRGTDNPKLHAMAEQFQENLDERWAHNIIQDDAFVSTSITPDNAYEYMRKSKGNHPVFLRIILPKGTKAAWIDGITDVGQAELLLAPDAEFEVIQAITRNQKGQRYTYLTVRYINAR